MAGKLTRFRMPWSWNKESFGKVFFWGVEFFKVRKTILMRKNITSV
jgi:hypothetical protein